MKVLSIKQPWLELILSGKKDVEVRTWQTKYRGDLLLHASQSVDFDACERFGILPERVVKGAIVGRCRLVDVLEFDNFSWIETFERHLNTLHHFEPGRFGWVLDKVERVPVKIVSGRLGLWDYEERPVSHPGIVV